MYNNLRDAANSGIKLYQKKQLEIEVTWQVWKQRSEWNLWKEGHGEDGRCPLGLLHLTPRGCCLVGSVKLFSCLQRTLTLSLVLSLVPQDSEGFPGSSWTQHGACFFDISVAPYFSVPQHCKLEVGLSFSLLWVTFFKVRGILAACLSLEIKINLYT